MSQSVVVSLVYGAAPDTSNVGTAESALKVPVVAETLTVGSDRYFFLGFDFQTYRVKRLRPIDCANCTCSVTK